MKWHLILVLLIVVNGVRILIRQVRKYFQQISSLKQHGIRTYGVVVRNKFLLGDPSVFRPLIRFTTQQGVVIEALERHGLAMAIPRFSKGEKVNVLYENDNPVNFKII